MKVGWFVVAFCSAFTVAGNLMRLLPVNPNYEAAWWKVAAGLISFATFVYLGVKENRNVRR